MNIFIVSQIVGAVAILFWVVSIQNKEQHKILFLQAMANLTYTIQYSMLGAFEAAYMNFLSTIRCYIFYIKRKNNKDISNLWLIFFCILIIILGVLTYKDLFTLIPIIITLFYTVSSWMKNSIWIRIVFLIAGCIWIYYNYKVGAYICIIGNVFEIISGITSLIRFSGKDKEISN